METKTYEERLDEALAQASPTHIPAPKSKHDVYVLLSKEVELIHARKTKLVKQVARITQYIVKVEREWLRDMRLLMRAGRNPKTAIPPFERWPAQFLLSEHPDPVRRKPNKKDQK